MIESWNCLPSTAYDDQDDDRKLISHNYFTQQISLNKKKQTLINVSINSEFCFRRNQSFSIDNCTTNSSIENIVTWKMSIYQHYSLMELETIKQISNTFKQLNLVSERCFDNCIVDTQTKPIINYLSKQIEVQTKFYIIFFTCSVRLVYV